MQSMHVKTLEGKTITSVEPDDTIDYKDTGGRELEDSV